MEITLSEQKSSAHTISYLGIRLTVQCDDPNDQYYRPQDFFPTHKQGGVYIGRSTGNDISLPHTGVSSVHCRIETLADGYTAEDAGSSNGTYVGHRRLSQGEKYPLRDGDVIRIVSYHITFRLGLSAFAPLESNRPEELDSTLQVGRQMVQQFLNSPEEHSPQLLILNKAEAGQSFALREYEDFVIGRDPETALYLQDDAISRRHAMLRRDWSGVTLRDLNSSNGVYINGIRIQANTEVEIHDSDQIGVGHYLLLFRDPFAASLEDKLKGVWIEEKNDQDAEGETLIADRLSKPKLQLASEVDIREPMSGRWRSPPRSPKNKPDTMPPAEPAKEATGGTRKPTDKSPIAKPKPSDERHIPTSNLNTNSPPYADSASEKLQPAIPAQHPISPIVSGIQRSHRIGLLLVSIVTVMLIIAIIVLLFVQ